MNDEGLVSRRKYFDEFCSLLCPNATDRFEDRKLRLFELCLDQGAGLTVLLQQARVAKDFERLSGIRPPQSENSTDYKKAAVAYIQSQTGVRLPISEKISSGFYEEIVLYLNND